MKNKIIEFMNWISVNEKSVDSMTNGFVVLFCAYFVVLALVSLIWG